MLNILNIEVKKRLFSAEQPTWLISFLNEGFFLGKEKIVTVIWTDYLTESLLHFQSCFHETIACKVKTNKGQILLVQIVTIRIHPGKDTSFVKLKDAYFDVILKLEGSYAYQLPLMYIGLFTFDFGDLSNHYHFLKSANNYPLDLHFLNLKTWNIPKKENWSVFEQWMYLFKENKSLTSIPPQINYPILLEVLNLLDEKQWSTIHIEDYDKDEKQWEKRNRRVLDLYQEIGSPIIEKYRKQPSTEITMSILPLLNQLTPQKIKISTDILSKAEWQKIAFNIFRKWNTQIQEKYPTTTIIIKNERQIVSDFNDILPLAIKHLILENKFYTKFREGWDVGYVIGFISGSLNTLWHHEYIIKQSDNFKILTILQVLRDYIKFNSTLKIQLTDLYEHFIKDNVNLQNFDITITQTDLSCQEQELNADNKRKQKTILIAIESIIQNQLNKTLDDKQFKTIDFKIENLISKEVIKKLIEMNKLEKTK